MKRMVRTSGVLAAVLFAVALLPGCKKDVPPVVWDPNQAGGGAPVITTVIPSDSALGAVSQVTLNGSNFAPVDSLNLVYFGGARAGILSCSPTQIVVLCPDTDASDLTIKVAVFGAYAMATHPHYIIRHAAMDYGGFVPLDEVYSIAVDASENLYAQLKADTGVYLVTPSGTKSLYGKGVGFTKASEMKMGPGGYLYLQQTSSTKIHRIAPGGGLSSPWATLPGSCRTIDFDSAGNIYAGGVSAGLFVVTPAGAARAVGAYAGISIRSVRVFAGYVYLLVDSPNRRVYRNAILNSNGDLGANEVAFDMTNAPSGYSSSTLFAITFSADGDMFIGTDNAVPLIVVHPDGSAGAFYPGVLKSQPTQSMQLAWGTGTYLYVNRDQPGTPSPTSPIPRGVTRVDIGKLGAPYYGRGN